MTTTNWLQVKNITHQRARGWLSAGLLAGALALAGCGGMQVGLETPTEAAAAATDTQAPPTVPTATSQPAHTATSAPTEVATLAPVQVGTVTGRVCYPSEFIPAMTAYFEHTTSGEISEVAIAEGQASYSVELAPGMYTAFSWRSEYAIGNGYSRMVTGTSGEQVAESLLPFEVLAGATTLIDLCDPLPRGIGPAGEAGTGAPAGLLYASGAGLQVLEIDGSLRLLSDRPDAVVSHDGTQLLVSQDNDIWLVDVVSGKKRNLTNTPGRVEHSPRWWPERPDLVVFSSYHNGREILMGPGMFPTVLALDSGQYTIVDEDNDAYSLALSPDGKTIAYGVGQIAWLYNVSTGEKTVFDPTAYGLNLNPTGASPVPQWSVSGPAFAPDGRRMTWQIGLFYADASNRIQTGFFDLDGRSAWLWHAYEMVATDGLPPAAEWSPDGQWVVVQMWSTDVSEAGLWLVHPGDRSERRLGPGAGAHFSANGLWLAYTDGNNETIGIALNSGASESLPRPPNAALIGWIAP
jgi:hypothetical protein